MSKNNRWWKWYQERIAAFFRRVEGALVAEDIKLHTRTGRRRRQIDVYVELPVMVYLSDIIQVTVPVRIIVDAKAHKRRIDVRHVGLIEDLRDDVGANLAIIASPVGFTEGAMERAREVGVFPLNAPTDLLAMLRDARIPEFVYCLNECDSLRGIVSWDFGEAYRSGSMVIGYCQRCNTIHVACPDCGVMFGIAEFEEGKSLECPGDCGRVFLVARDFETGEAHVSSRDWLDVTILRKAFTKSTRRLTKREVDQLVRQSKWQYFTEAPATIGLTEEELMEWDDEGQLFKLTESGEDYVRENLRDTKAPSLY